ncbi:MAG: sugar transferase [Blautia faecis]
MYRKDSEKWLKHLDFIILDMICLQMAFVLAYVIRRRGLNIYGDVLYRNMAIFLGFADLVVIFMAGIMKSVLKRGYYKEFVTTLEQAVGVGALAIAYLFMIQESQSFSRMILITTVIIYLFFNYIIREIWKKYLHKKMKNGGDRKLLIVTSKEVAEQVVKNMQENNYARYSLAGVVVIDDDLTGKKICDVPVVANADDVSMYVCQKWIDEVLIVVSENVPYPEEIVDKLTETGVTVHLNLAKITNKTGKRQFVEKVGNYTVLTTSLNYASLGQLMLKRLMDICGGIVGCIATGIICLFVGPAIYIASPGPIFFSQERVGKNGKKFKMYKFRSMYMDAEERKAELMKENKLGDGKMFKMDFDPRVIGNKVLPDGAHKTGVGDFIRRTSLDEFPQFFNVLKGDMSIVGTRPPLISETNLYEPRHKVRLAIKPGITGMWQVSGRSDITDFEEVVRLDKEYIENWNIGLDIKILFKTVMVVITKDGSM